MKEEYQNRKARDKDIRHPAPCFDIVFPITFVMPDGTEIRGDSADEIHLAIREWYANNPGTKEKPAMQYPVTIVYEDGTEVEIENEEAMIEAKKACVKERNEEKKREHRMPCFEMVYPLVYVMPDGSEIKGENEEELRQAIMEWYKANPQISAKPELQFPVEIIFEDGTTETIDDRDALIAAFKACFCDEDEEPVDDDVERESDNPTEGGIVSVNDMSGLSGINSYPNPATEILNVRFVAEDAGNIEISLVDYAGNTVLKFEDAVLLGTNEIEIPVSGLSNGKYFVRIQTSRGIETVPFVISK
jgi:hypothetical protein